MILKFVTGTLTVKSTRILIYKLTAVEKRLLGNEFIIMLLNTSSHRSGSTGQYCVHLSEDGFNFTYIAI